MEKKQKRSKHRFEQRKIKILEKGKAKAGTKENLESNLF